VQFILGGQDKHFDPIEGTLKEKVETPHFSQLKFSLISSPISQLVILISI